MFFVENLRQHSCAAVFITKSKTIIEKTKANIHATDKFTNYFRLDTDIFILHIETVFSCYKLDFKN